MFIPSLTTAMKKSSGRTSDVGYRTRVGLERRTRTKSRIVAAALRVFAAKGMDTPVIDDFIREAGVAHGTFYNYFTRTEQLLLAVSRSLEDDLMLAIEAEMSELRDPVVRLATGVRLWLGWARADPVWCAFIVKSRFRGALVEQQLRMDLKNGRKSGALNFASIEAARDLVVGTILEAMSRIMTAPVSKAYTDGVARSILTGLGLEATQADRVLKARVPRLRRPVQKAGVKEPSSPR
ncbi:MAG: TetR/AcrR family transcriptional regulator [Proteobacteria bacterium]|nr:TetR/AcrR family transcriptional regulator [Pseudomonadota bacterium]